MNASECYIQHDLHNDYFCYTDGSSFVNITNSNIGDSMFTSNSDISEAGPATLGIMRTIREFTESISYVDVETIEEFAHDRALEFYSCLEKQIQESKGVKLQLKGDGKGTIEKAFTNHVIAMWSLYDRIQHGSDEHFVVQFDVLLRKMQDACVTARSINNGQVSELCTCIEQGIKSCGCVKEVVVKYDVLHKRFEDVMLDGCFKKFFGAVSKIGGESVQVLSDSRKTCAEMLEQQPGEDMQRVCSALDSVLYTIQYFSNTDNLSKFKELFSKYNVDFPNIGEFTASTMTSIGLHTVKIKDEVERVLMANKIASQSINKIIVKCLDETK